MLLQNLLAALFTIDSRRVARRYKFAALPFNVLNFAVIAVAGSSFALLTAPESIQTGALTQYLGRFIFAGVCFALSGSLAYAVLQFVDAATATLLSTLNILAAIGMSIILLHEGLDLRQLLGACVLLSGVELVLLTKTNKIEHQHIRRAVLLSVASALIYALAITSEKFLLNHMNVSTYLVFGWGFQCIAMFIVLGLLGRFYKADFSLLRTPTFYTLALRPSVWRALAGLLFVTALKQSNNLSIVSALTGLKLILVALIGAWLLGERDHLRRKLSAAVMAMLGIAIIYWN